MTVGQLRKIIEKLPDDTRVLAPSADHSFHDVDASASTALYDRRSGWTEDYGEDQTPEAEFGERRSVLVIR